MEVSCHPLLPLVRHTELMEYPLTGYSWKTNQYGLPADTVTEFELVLPSGEVKVVTEKDEDLWFALKVCLKVDDEDGTMSSRRLRASGRIQQLREFTTLIIKATQLTKILCRKGIVTKFTMKSHLQTDVWVCPFCSCSEVMSQRECGRVHCLALGEIWQILRVQPLPSS